MRTARFACATLVVALFATTATHAQDATAKAAPNKAAIKPEELDQVLAPIALYPDDLLTQILMASTFPLEVVEADRWVKKHKSLKGDALAKALEKEDWDPSVKSLVNVPDVLASLSANLDSLGKIGDAFLADQKAVMAAIQKLRKKAKDAGNLENSEKMTVEEKADGGSEVIVIQSSDPKVIYVPAYDPRVIYGPWWYPAYPPPIYYRPPYWVPGPVIGFGVGFACGVAWGYAWGRCGWGYGRVDIDINRNVNLNANIDRNKYKRDFQNRGGNANGKGAWKHDPKHRKGVAYRDKATANRFGGKSKTQAAQARKSFRGHKPSQASRPTHDRSTNRSHKSSGRSAFSGSHRSTAKQHSNRGRASRASHGRSRFGGGGARRGGGRRR